MKVKAHAKINLALDVVRKREDGYHDLEMVMAPISLHDLIYIDIIDEGIIIESNNVRMPTDERNIMYKVAKRLIDDYNINAGVKIFIYKHIPTQAGLAGGSADGAAVLRAMNKLFHLNLSLEKLAEIGKDIGADIPFCVFEKTSFVGGIGEQLDFIEHDFDCNILLVKPKRGVSTQKSFGMLTLATAIHPDIKAMVKSIEENNYNGVIENLGNTLEAPSLVMVPEIQKIKEELIELGFDGALMSGSGSTVFALTKDDELFEKGYHHFKESGFFVRKTRIYKK